MTADVAAALATIGAVLVAPGVYEGRLSTGQVVLVTEPATTWTTCSSCGDLVAAAPEKTLCDWCEVAR
jgi:hypothetical protein